MVALTLHYDWRAPDFGPPPEALYAAALVQCEWADRLGFQSVTISTHHGSPDNYCPAPLVAATAIAARTQRMRISPVLALPLFHPLRVAEDVAVLDLISDGRVDLVVGAGYRREEFDMFGEPMSRRGARMEEGVKALRQAWTGEPFEFRGKRVLVTPRPKQRPGPRITMGGWSEAAARRAARLADAFLPVDPEVYETYRKACGELGREVPPPFPARPPWMFLHVTEDPDEAWARIAPHALHVSNSYGRWLADAGGPAVYTVTDSIETLRASDTFQVVTPERCIELGRKHGVLSFDPLFGGLPPKLAWESLTLFERRVLPALRG